MPETYQERVARLARARGNWPPDGSLPARVQEYVEWLVSPERQPTSKVAWAKEHGTTQQTVHSWEKDDRVIKAIDKQASALNMSPERIQRVMNSVFRAAEGGDMNAAKLYLQHVDRLAPKRIKIEDDRVDTLTDEQLERELVTLGLRDVHED